MKYICENMLALRLTSEHIRFKYNFLIRSLRDHNKFTLLKHFCIINIYATKQNHNF